MGLTGSSVFRKFSLQSGPRVTKVEYWAYIFKYNRVGSDIKCHFDSSCPNLNVLNGLIQSKDRSRLETRA